MTDANDDVNRWSWIAPDGRVGSGPARELASALKGGGLPPGTFVWKQTWLEWLPANRVAEFVAAIPAGKGETVREPKRAATALTPPFRPREAPIAPAIAELLRPPAAPQRPAKPAPPGEDRPSSFGIIGKARGPSVLGPRSEATTDSTAPREPMPTLGEEPVDTRATLRPPGAVPPPPRAVQAPPLRASPAQEHQTPRRVPALGAAASPRDTISDSDLSDAPLLQPSELRPALVLPGTPASVDIRSQTPKTPAAVDLESTLGSTPFEPRASAVPQAEPQGPNLENVDSSDPVTLRPPPPPDGATSERSSRMPLPRSLLVGMVLLAGIAALLAAGMVALVLRRSREAPAAATSALASASAPPASPVRTCRLLEPAARLATSVHRAVPPLLAEIAPGKRVAVGLAVEPKNAAGLLVDLATLDVERAFEQADDKPLFGVVPLLASGSASFVADRADGKLGGMRTVAAGLAIGVNGTDLVRTAGGASQVLWAGAASEKITDPRVASGSAGHLVTFRRGGLAGRVHYGWLEPDGSPRGELGTLEVPDITLTGTPDPTVSGDEGLIVFAGRPSPEAEWRIQLASIPKQGKPELHAFQTPSGGPGGGSIAPSASGLGRDGWILQWTEGTSGKYQVRGQRLGVRFEPIAEPWLVSPKGANAGQGAVFVSGSRVLSVFVQTTAGHDELWGASFECP
jgi:hypothetical protein